MKFGPLNYSDSKGLYEDDPSVEEMRDKMERALVTKAQREIRRILTSRSWVIKSHGSSPHAMSLDVAFHIMSDGDIAAIETKARLEERLRLRGEMQAALHEVMGRA